MNFTLPDTACVGEVINITNQTTDGGTFYWNFCSEYANQNPTGKNLGNPTAILDVPTYITLAKYGVDCFGFVSCQGIPGVARIFFGTSFRNDPVNTVSLGSFGLLTNFVEGIQVKEDNGNWYGFITNYGTLIRLDFGTSLWNTPVAVDIGPFAPMQMGHGLFIIKEGDTWLGFLTCSVSQNLLRFNFGSSLTNTPTCESFGNIGGLSNPTQISLICDNGSWYLFNANGLSNTLSRITFGNSLLNTPTGVNLGNPGGFFNVNGLIIISDCGNPTGYFSEYLPNGQLGKLSFPDGIAGTPSSILLGNLGNLERPHSFSELFRESDSLYTYLPNRGDGTLTRFMFPPCNNASVPSSTLFTPPPFSYNQPGTYNVHLIVNEGLPNQASLCREVVITGAHAPNFIDTTLCFGTRWYAEGAWRTTPGIYYDTIQFPGSCDSIVQTTLNFEGDCHSALWFPNVFTPNGDGLNDTYHPVGIGVTRFNITIYDRWGMRVFESDTPEPGWDGLLKGRLCSDGVYVFVATYQLNDTTGETYQAHGSITLLR